MPYIRPITINDDKGNPLNLNTDQNLPNGRTKGKSNSTDENGNRYPYGFTPAVDFVVSPQNVDPDTGIPIELGIYRKDLGKRTTDPNEKLVENTSTYALFGDNSGLEFKHSYDHDENGVSRTIGLTSAVNKEINIASFTNSGNDNEDPTVYGYDLLIDIDNSPLFNGAIEDFINQFSMIEEVAARLPIYQSFKEKFFKYFNSLTTQASKNHYLKSISGLNKLTESNSSDKTVSFTEYNKDTINITLYEDVTMGIGEIMNLYKTLSWSRMSGKTIIPENLLRFEAELVITEVKKYNRIVKMTKRVSDTSQSEDQNTSGGILSGVTSAIDPYFTASPLNDTGTISTPPNDTSVAPTDAVYLIADLLSKYRYRIYECQFFFPNLPHGDTLDMWNVKEVDSAELIFDYKFSTMKHEKFTWDENVPSAIIVNNGLNNPLELAPSDSDGQVDQNGRISKKSKTYEVSYIDSWSLNNDGLTTTELLNVSESEIDKLKNSIGSAAGAGNSLSTMLLKIRNAAFTEVNRQIMNKARLINRSINNIRNSIGLGKMSEPTNVYQDDYMKGNMFPSSAKNAVRDFVGDSIKGMFN